MAPKWLKDMTCAEREGFLAALRREPPLDAWLDRAFGTYEGSIVVPASEIEDGEIMRQAQATVERATCRVIGRVVTIDEDGRYVVHGPSEIKCISTIIAIKAEPPKAEAICPEGDCPCGRTRAGCEYHDPRLA